MKLEVGKEYKCGENIVCIIARINDAAPMGFSETYIAECVTLDAKQIGIFHSDGIPSAYNSSVLSKNLEVYDD